MSCRSHSASVLYLVATPIGNLGDLSARAREVLASVPLVAAEDTRVARKLLRSSGVKAPRLLSVRAANEAAGAGRLADLVEEGGSAAYVSDAGTPGLSDPGSVLAATMHERGIRVEPVPGPCAAAVAASVSGLCGRGFVFAGFLPRSGAERKRAIGAILSRDLPTVLFESPARIAATTRELARKCGAEAPACLCRELTKMHEQICRADIGGLADMLEAGQIPAKGEFTLVLASPVGEEGAADLGEAIRLGELLAEHLPVSRAVALAARHCGVSKSDLYEAVLKRR